MPADLSKEAMVELAQFLIRTKKGKTAVKEFLGKKIRELGTHKNRKLSLKDLLEKSGLGPQILEMRAREFAVQLIGAGSLKKRTRRKGARVAGGSNIKKDEQKRDVMVKSGVIGGVGK